MARRRILQRKAGSAASALTLNAPIAAAIIPQPIVEEMQSSYLDYAMSVIVSRALPDVRDGLKPVHRRILYAMWTLGLKPNAKFRKSATVTGEVLGKFHPHGDVAVYDSLVRMAQDFSMRYPLIHGQGNFGSMDGDGAAAMRYTECKLSKISENLLTDIEKETVLFVPNYDGSQKEPTVLPAILPNLLLNGTVGIAVGMATNIPPHNLTELVDAIMHLADHPRANVEDLMTFIKGPDFPTGGEIYDAEEIQRAYATGRGAIVIRAKTEIVETKNGDFHIIVTEIPYQVNKALLVEKIADLVREKKIDGIRDLRDESDKDGVRVVIELKKGSYPRKILNRLFTLTSLQTTFHVNLLALVDGIQPRVLTLKMILEEYLKHRTDVVRKRTQYDLTKAENRAHILEGLKIALVKIDAVIDTIKKSKDKDVARENLMKKFRLSELQAIAILEMRLQQLANLERLKVLQELKEMLALIEELKGVLKSPAKILAIVKKELGVLKEQFGDERRTKVFPNPVGKFTQEDLIPKESTILMVTRDGYIKRQPPEAFKTQGRGGKGVIGLTTKEEDMVEHFFSPNTHADILFFTSKGRVFQLKAYDIPVASRTAKGQALVNFLQLAPEERVSAILSADDLSSYEALIMVTKNGLIKRVEVESFLNVRKSGLIAIKLKGDDRLEWIKPSEGKDEVLLISKNGQAIRFKEKDIRVMGRVATGVRGMRLKNGDEIVGMDLVTTDVPFASQQVFVVMSEGFGKRTGLTNYKVQNRGGSGVKTAKISKKTGAIIAGFIVADGRTEQDVLVISTKGQVIRLPLKSVSVHGRATQGVRLMRFKESEDHVANVTLL
ncbi:MAG: DNA gyrase subunit A [Candidatus Kerfeldbacteria bacterium]|nr:DNA gyrase subunit A [Candidatus Kerfeldbacteria bacterium]